MEQLPRAIVIAAIIIASAFILRGIYPADRFSVVPAQGGGAFRIDRLTGATAFCDALACRQLPIATFHAPAKPSPGAPASGATT